MAQSNQNSSKTAYRKLSKKNREFLCEIYSQIRYCTAATGEPSDLREVFQPEAIDYLLGVKSDGALIDSLIEAGYKDVPEVDENGEPILRRRTPIHSASEWDEDGFVTSRLFRIYDRFDVNYTDGSGLTHFHLACYQNCADEVKKFLELGQDPNCLTNDGDSPLFYALRYPDHEILELLLRGGANPNLANKEGSTPLHYICDEAEDEDLAKMIFELSDEKYRPVQVNARDKLGNAPLHFAIYGDENLVELLLKNGADPNLANEEGSTPLHIICKDSIDVNYSLELFFKICDEVNQPVRVDARDDLGRTPLQYAVARLLPDVVDLLLDHGADLSSFVFPTESHFREMSLRSRDVINFKLRTATGLLAVVESLEKRGYELDRSDALRIMKFFVKHGFIQYSSDIRKHWFGYHKFTSEAKKLMIQPNLSLHDLMTMQPEEASKRLAYSDYHRFSLQDDFKYISKDLKEAYSVYMGEKISRGFFRRWTLEYLLALTSKFKLPTLCCETIAKQLINKDLWHVHLAVTGQNS